MAAVPFPERTELVETLASLPDPHATYDTLEWLWAGFALAVAEGRDQTALRLAGGAEALSRRRRRNGSEEPVLVPLEPLLERARREAGPAVADRLRAEGSQMSPYELVAQATAELSGEAPDTVPDGPSDGSSDNVAGHAPLSPREREVMDLVANGMSNGEIAEALFISKRTVETHVDHVKRKLGVTTRHHVIARALRSALV
jgi:DNA-binding CsgD family transcriptional regulator